MSQAPGQHAGDNDNAEKRPSFKAFWKQCKDAATTGRGLRFKPGRRGSAKAVDAEAVASAAAGAGATANVVGPADDVTTTVQSPSAAAEDPAALEARRKAQARRAQVRRAQVQHRKRKADYTKQLETEIADYRNLIADVGVECALLKGENDAARALLAAAAVCVLPPQQSQPVSYFDDIDIDDLMVSLVTDQAMGAQTWQVSQVPHPTAVAAAAAVSTPVPPPTSSPVDEQQGPDSDGEVNPDLPEDIRLSPAQTQQAINLILAVSP
ncbi:hypothetical protein MAPG_06726 [Magnaporthiopsis poae ATCC 64411]|uniref:BZIP domain-containing protein n=1 Tax=Magnaporthiopsis poae (strain ATCC 64411 / 73-15) TaxID=644358 RepID=A0A0C4E2T6_MAGP6|nr:hypothetical protein MAPG_06726 [Magnaporthiopsis poae ATCC 64411]